LHHWEETSKGDGKETEKRLTEEKIWRKIERKQGGQAEAYEDDERLRYSL